MLIQRFYIPKENEILYHYCDANAFYSICDNKKIRLSDLFGMNDFLEMHWGYSIWEKVASGLFKETGEEFLKKVDEVICRAGVLGLLTATCFSQNGDVLSQWRAYADDGRGFAVGFDAASILKLPVSLLKVLYEEDEQIAEARQAIKVIYEIEKKAEFKYSKEFREMCRLFAYDLAALKNPSFKEEKEIRATHLLRFEKSNGSLKIIDYGGIAFDKETEGKPILFRIRDNTPVPYIEEDFSNAGEINPIKEVIIGPKNLAKPTTISIFLETLGLGNVLVRQSKASYR